MQITIAELEDYLLDHYSNGGIYRKKVEKYK